MNKTAWLGGLALAASIGSFSTPGVAAVNAQIAINVGPPPLRVEAYPAPRRGMVWTPGFWDWQGRHIWVPGHWVSERRGQRWIQPEWVSHNGRWLLVRGHWAQGHGGSRGDQDRDGIRNRYDRDRDGDGVRNRVDRDRDGDGVRNRNDRRPDNPRRQ